MSFWKRNPVELEIIRLERGLDYAETDEERKQITDRLSEMYKLNAERQPNKMHITGDGLMKCLTAIGLAVVGYIVESKGGIIPKWSQQKP